jgi:hypothetical protein
MNKEWHKVIMTLMLTLIDSVSLLPVELLTADSVLAKTASKLSESVTFVAAKDWFKKSVDWAVDNGITSSYGQGTFSPKVTCNRAISWCSLEYRFRQYSD